MLFEIITDSSANLPQAFIEENNLHILSLSYYIGDEEFSSYVPGQKNDLDYFYEKLNSKANIRTSLVNVDSAMSYIGRLMKEKKDILYIGFSSGLSGSYQSVSLAVSDLQDVYKDSEVFCVDSLSAALGEGLLVYYACKLRSEGKSLKETRNWLEENKLKMLHWFTVDDLFYLKRGGRISAAAAVFGSALSIKPIMNMDKGGHLQVYGKARGRKKALNELLMQMKESVENPEEQIFGIAHADCEEDAMYMKDKMMELNPKDIFVEPFEPVIASHTGPGCIAIFFMGKER
ncbi:DegV family protein [[Clostridium] polysaccharolyticum]|uniref:EDD domain protein, DegV family n=1 Tax=[Clostridium] polysaccharolyticum TaxID=29364 RepID=A0A1I0B1E1_9FIRM|nr:DegV family protein [[Clostridium] polysaccharolyticum]SES99890.1 EDD domain protein, DegV family [[Clostridium] polysaccharolyticum]